MKIKKLLIYSGVLVLQIIGLKLLASNPEFIEQYYSNGIYEYTSRLFRYVFGWIPFSFGDLMYTAVIVYLLVAVFKLFRNKFKTFIPFLTQGILFANIIYLAFHVLWGLNYYRLPLHQALGIENQYTTEEVISLTQRLIKKANMLHERLQPNDTLPVVFQQDLQDIFDKTPEGYAIVEDNFPKLDYHPKSIKNSLYRYPLSYMGFGGYLNPITQEGQINGLLPAHRWPLVSCHEEAHQLGFAKENEANFIAVMATTNNPDPYFKYSGYIFALRYCLSDVYQRNPAAGELLSAKIKPGILANCRQSRDFWMAYQNPLEPLLAKFYGGYLKANNQPAGMQSYNYVVALLVNYFKKRPLHV